MISKLCCPRHWFHIGAVSHNFPFFSQRGGTKYTSFRVALIRGPDRLGFVNFKGWPDWSPTARGVLTRPPTGTPRRNMSPGEGRPVRHTSLQGSGRGCPLLRASNEHSFTVRVLRARMAPGHSLLSFSGRALREQRRLTGYPFFSYTGRGARTSDDHDRNHTAAFLMGSRRLSAESNREQGQAPLDRIEEPVP